MSLCMDYADVFYIDAPMDTSRLTCHRSPRTFPVCVRQYYEDALARSASMHFIKR